MLIAVVSDVVWQALIAAVVTIVLAWMARNAAVKVEEVKETLEVSTETTGAKLDSISTTTEAVHVLVNSSMSNQLKVSMVALSRVAELTKHQDDIAAAELATRLFHEHELKQAQLDAGKKA